MMEDEFEIIGWKEGVGQDVGTVIWVCARDVPSKSGPPVSQEFSVRPKGTREQRRQWFVKAGKYMGKPLIVRFQELSRDGIPRFPVGIGIRDYE